MEKHRHDPPSEGSLTFRAAPAFMLQLNHTNSHAKKNVTVIILLTDSQLERIEKKT
jgi:hypothetical protein